MNALVSSLALSCALLVSASALADAPASAPAGAMGLCKDGSYSTDAAKKGACKGHKGVKTWYGGEAAAPAVAPASMPMGSKMPMAPASKAASAAQAPGGGPGMVWVNVDSKVYHCEGTKYYGKTKHGQYMTESAAKAGGNHADHGKACS